MDNHEGPAPERIQRGLKKHGWRENRYVAGIFSKAEFSDVTWSEASEIQFDLPPANSDLERVLKAWWKDAYVWLTGVFTLGAIGLVGFLLMHQDQWESVVGQYIPSPYKELMLPALPFLGYKLTVWLQARRDATKALPPQPAGVSQ